MWGGWSTSWKRVSNQRRLVPQERVAAAGVAAHAKRRAPVYAAGLCRRSCGPSARSQAVARPAPAMATTSENLHRTGASADETLDRAGHHAADHPDSAFREEDVRVRLAATRFTRPLRLCTYLTVKSLSTWATTMVGVPVSRGRPRRQDDRLFSPGSPGPRCGAAIPSVDGGVINGHASLGHHRFDVTQAQRVGCVPAHANQHHLQRTRHPLDHHAHRLDHPHRSVVRLGSSYQRGRMRENPTSECGEVVTEATDTTSPSRSNRRGNGLGE